MPDASVRRDGVLAVGGVALDELAERFSTPLYVYDAATIRARARAYREPVAARGGRVVFALKALSTPAVLALLRAEGLGADVASAGELAAARLAGFDGAEMIVHGNAKSDDDLAAAIDARAGLLVIDGVDEAERLGRLVRASGRTQDVLVRLTPGVAVDTHEKVMTGHVDSKFGVSPADARHLLHALPEGLVLRGLHVHLGSQVLDAAPLVEIASFCAHFCRANGLAPEVLDLGGGLGVAYREGTSDVDPRAFATAVAAAVPAAFASADLPPPQLVLEPGRSVVARGGVTLYRVIAVKETASGRRYVAVDGGLADNPRPALYGAPYTATPVRASRAAAVTSTLVGRHCESSDVIAEDVALPPVAAGDLLCVPVTGAYHQTMASTYNLFPRPAAVLVEDGQATLVTRRETVDELFTREVLPPRHASTEPGRP